MYSKWYRYLRSTMNTGIQYATALTSTVLRYGPRVDRSEDINSLKEKSVQNRDARAVDYPSEQRVMVMMVSSTPVPGTRTHAHTHELAFAAGVLAR